MTMKYGDKINESSVSNVKTSEIHIMCLYMSCRTICLVRRFYLISNTRMHSSRMRTVCCNSRLGGGCLPGRGGLCVYLGEGGVPGVVYPGGCLPATPPPALWTEWQTHVKTLPCRNYVADGKYNGPLTRCICLWIYRKEWVSMGTSDGLHT